MGHFNELIFVDIETTSQVKEKTEYSEPQLNFLNKRFPDGFSVFDGALYPETGKIVCAVFYKDNVATKIYNKDERVILLEIQSYLSKYDKSSERLVAHNGLAFDYPYISKRLLFNRFKIPRILSTVGLKPWENRLLDTVQIFKMGSQYNMSLEILADSLGLPTPKDDIKGAEVPKLFWDDFDASIDRIVEYCRKDTETISEAVREYFRFL